MGFYSEGLEFMVNLVAVPEEKETKILLTELKMPDISGLSTAEKSPLIVGMSVSELLREMNQLSGENKLAANKIFAFRKNQLDAALAKLPPHLKPPEA
jgi:hypothetical protein